MSYSLPGSSAQTTWARRAFAGPRTTGSQDRRTRDGPRTKAQGTKA